MRVLASLLFFVPVLSLVVLFRAGGSGWRQAVLRGGITSGLVVVGLAELLTLGHWFGAPALLAAWSVLTVGLGSAAVWALRRADPALRRVTAPRDAVEWALVVATGGLLLLQLAVAVAAPPNNWDSMTYHLPRVMHWLQQGGVEYYPTATDRQLYLGPLAEYAIAHLQALTGCDRLANTVQWLAELGCVAGVSWATSLLHGGRRAQLITGLAVVSLPALALEATSTQNDIVAALWAVAIVAAVLADLHRPSGWWLLLDIGAAVGLGFLTKATGLLVVVPFLLWWGVARLLRAPRRSLVLGPLAAAVAVVVAAPHLLRNLAVYHSPLGPPYIGPELSNENPGVHALAAGVVRDLATNLALPNPGWNEGVTDWVYHWLAKIGVNATAPSITFGRTHFEVLWKQHEDYATNFVHLLLIVAGLAVMLLPRWRGNRRVLYAVALVVGFLLFAGYLKWQPWITRLMVPLFVLGCPAIGLLLARERPPHRRRTPRRAALAALGAFGLGCAGYLAYLGGSWTWFNETRPVTGPDSVFTAPSYDVRMAARPALAEPYRAATRAVAASGAHAVGLARNTDDWEYPLWLLLDAPRPGIRIYAVNPTSYTAGLADYPPPDAVMCTRRDDGCEAWTGPSWSVHRYGPVTVALRVGARGEEGP